MKELTLQGPRGRGSSRPLSRAGERLGFPSRWPAPGRPGPPAPEAAPLHPIGAARLPEPVAGPAAPRPTGAGSGTAPPATGAARLPEPAGPAPDRSTGAGSGTAPQAGLLSPDRWLRVARDPEEQVTALYALAVLAHRAGQPEAALAAVEQALDVMPNSPILWRMRVAMAGGEPDVVNRARSHCPEDSELWLAGLVSAVQHSNRAVQAEADVRAAAAESRYSPGTFVRAGDYLLRHGRLEAAQAAARQALRGGRGLLAAQVLGLRVALASRDSRAALACARAAAGQAADPGPFLAIAVQLMMARDPDGPAAIPDLETLVALYPADPQWRLRLGHLRFRTGDIEGARTAFAPLTAALPAGLEPGLLTVMAETARLTGDRPASLRVLRESLGRHPASATLLNNLVYTLAQAPDGVAEAASLLPRLLAGTPSPAAWDTAGEVCWKAGEREQAQAHARRALATVKASDPAWAAIHLNAAEMQCALGNVRETEALLKETLGRPQDLGIAERQRIDALESRLARLKR